VRDPRTVIFRRLAREGHANFARTPPRVGTLSEQLAKATASRPEDDFRAFLRSVITEALIEKGIIDG
jgi:hypothetical protein